MPTPALPPQQLPLEAQWCVAAEQPCIALEVARSQEQQRLGKGRYVRLSELEALAPLSERVRRSFAANQMLNDDGLGFRLSLEPHDKRGLLQSLSLDHWGQLRTSFSW